MDEEQHQQVAGESDQNFVFSTERRHVDRQCDA